MKPLQNYAVQPGVKRRGEGVGENFVVVAVRRQVSLIQHNDFGRACRGWEVRAISACNFIILLCCVFFRRPGSVGYWFIRCTFGNNTRHSALAICFLVKSFERILNNTRSIFFLLYSPNLRFYISSQIALANAATVHFRFIIMICDWKSATSVLRRGHRLLLHRLVGHTSSDLESESVLVSLESRAVS